MAFPLMGLVDDRLAIVKELFVASITRSKAPHIGAKEQEDFVWMVEPKLHELPYGIRKLVVFPCPSDELMLLAILVIRFLSALKKGLKIFFVCSISGVGVANQLQQLLQVVFD